MLPSKKWILFALLSWTAVAPMLAGTGTNIVTQTYERAADHFWAGEDPYAPPNGKGDWFKYSPLFAAAYGPFAALPDVLQALAWAALNCAFFWAGIFRWFRPGRQTSPALWAAFAVAAAELDTSLRYQQINALIAGVALIAIAEIRDRRDSRAARWIALDTNLKILPGFFAAVLLIPWSWKYSAHLLIFSAELLLLPALRLGLDGCLQAHLHWAQVLLSDIGAPGLLDIGSVLARLQLPTVGWLLKLTIVPLTFGILVALRIRRVAPFPWGIFYTLGAACLLLFSPRTESPTFVLLAPAYLFLMVECRALPQRAWRNAAIAAWALIAFFGTVAYTDIWPKGIWDPRAGGFATKTLAALAAYGFALVLLIRRNPRVLFFRR